MSFDTLGTSWTNGGGRWSIRKVWEEGLAIYLSYTVTFGRMTGIFYGLAVSNHFGTFTDNCESKSQKQSTDHKWRREILPPFQQGFEPSVLPLTSLPLLPLRPNRLSVAPEVFTFLFIPSPRTSATQLIIYIYIYIYIYEKRLTAF